MNNQHVQAAVSVLGFTRDGEDGWGRLGQLSEHDWVKLLAWLDRSGLALYFWQKVRKSKLRDVIQPAIRAQFAERQTLNLTRTQAMLQEWRGLQRHFDSAGLNCVVLKGLAKVPDYCPDSALRIQFDHDWLIERNSLSRAHNLLRTAGFEKKAIREQDRAVYVRSCSPLMKAWKPADSYSPTVQRPVELHLSLWDCQNEKVSFELPEDFLARSVCRTWQGDQFSSLCDEDLLVFEVLHAFRHVIHNGCRLSVFYEIAHFLHQRSSDQDFWLRFRARIESRLRLRQAAGVVLTLAASLFGLPEVCRAVPAEFFELTPALRLWIEGYGMRSALENFSANKFSLFLLKEFVDERSNWRELRRRRLFPLQTSRRIRAKAGKPGSNTFAARVQGKIFFVRRLWFHLRGTLSYAWAFPRWQFLIRLETKRRLSFPLEAASPANAGRSKSSASRLGSEPSVRKSSLAMRG